MIVTSGETKVIDSFTSCMFLSSISVTGGTLLVNYSCTANGVISIQSGGRVEIASGATLTGAYTELKGSSTMNVRGTLVPGQIFVYSNSVLNLLEGSTLDVTSTISIESNAKVVSAGHSFTLTTMRSIDGIFECGGFCKITANTGMLTNSKFLANAVSMAHQDCTAGKTTISSGGNHAGCSGEHSCCPSGSLKPAGSFQKPTQQGYKGGTCADDGAGKGGGAWALTFASFHTLSGTNVIQANGGAPNTSKTATGGGGSGGSIFLSIPCTPTIESFFRLQAHGGNAAAGSGLKAYGGSAGRIVMSCSSLSGELPFRDVTPYYAAHGGMNAGIVGWGAAGTIMTPYGSGMWIFQVLNINEDINRYTLQANAFPPLTFFNKEDVLMPFLRTGTKSDIYITCDICTGETVDVIASISDFKQFGAITNGSPTKMTLNPILIDVRPTVPRTPPVTGQCEAYYLGTKHILPSFFNTLSHMSSELQEKLPPLLLVLLR